MVLVIHPLLCAIPTVPGWAFFIMKSLKFSRWKDEEWWNSISQCICCTVHCNMCSMFRRRKLSHLLCSSFSYNIGRPMDSCKPSLIYIINRPGFKFIMNHDAFQIVKNLFPVEASCSAETCCFWFSNRKAWLL